MEFGQIFRGLGFNYLSLNGHSYRELENLKSWILDTTDPRICRVKTIKGKGVSYMEGKLKWHHSIPDKAMYDRAIEELEQYD